MHHRGIHRRPNQVPAPRANGEGWRKIGRFRRDGGRRNRRCPGGGEHTEDARSQDPDEDCPRRIDDSPACPPSPPRGAAPERYIFSLYLKENGAGVHSQSRRRVRRASVSSLLRLRAEVDAGAELQPPDPPSYTAVRAAVQVGTNFRPVRAAPSPSARGSLPRSLLPPCPSSDEMEESPESVRLHTPALPRTPATPMPPSIHDCQCVKYAFACHPLALPCSPFGWMTSACTIY